MVNDIDPKDRDVAMVFQSYALYPHLTVAKNIEFPLRQRGVDKEERATKVKRAAETLGLGTLLDRKPGQLSGGQRQRVALARAIVREPTVFLMDEPLSNLDAALRVQTRADIVELQARLSTTTLYVTHDQVEAMTMGDRIAVMSEGQLQQVAAPEDLYARPANAFVAHFLGSPGMNLMEGMLVESGTTEADGAPWRGTLSVAFAGAAVPLPDAVADTVRGSGPEVVLGPAPRGAAPRAPTGPSRASVIIVELLGAETHVICQTETGARIIVRQSAGGGQAQDRRGRAHRRRPRPGVVPPLRRRHRRPPGGTVTVAPPVDDGGRRPEPSVRRRGAATARKQALLGYLLLLPALVALRGVLLLSLPAQLQADALRDAAGTRACRRTTSACTRSSPPSPRPSSPRASSPRCSSSSWWCRSASSPGWRWPWRPTAS